MIGNIIVFFKVSTPLSFGFGSKLVINLCTIIMNNNNIPVALITSTGSGTTGNPKGVQIKINSFNET